MITTNKSKFIYILGIFLLGLITLILVFFKDQSVQDINAKLSIRNNLWGHYGQKSIKAKLYEIEKNHLALYLHSLQNPNEITANKVIIANLDRELQRYKSEQNSIQEEAIKADNEFENNKKGSLILGIMLLISQICLLILSFYYFIFIKPQESRN
jgi:ATP-dependent Zn protease